MYSARGLLERLQRKVRAGVIFGVRIIRLPGPSRRAVTSEERGSAWTDSNKVQELNRKSEICASMSGNVKNTQKKKVLEIF